MKPKSKNYKNLEKGTLFKTFSSQIAYGLMAVMLITLLVFSGNLNNEVLVGWDDGVYLENADVQNLGAKGIVGIFGSFHLGMYQPIPVISFALNYAVHGDSAFGYHFINLLLHLLNTFLVFSFIRKLRPGGDLTALFVTLLFAIHPMHVEAVSWISTRSNAIFTSFYLMAAIYYLHYLDTGLRNKYLLFTFIFVILGLFSKSMAVSFPFLMLILDYNSQRKPELKSLLEKLPFFGLSVIFGLIAIRGASTFGHIESLSVDYNLFERAMMITGALWFYMWKMILPLNLSAIYTFPQPEAGLLPLGYYASIPVLAALIFLLIKYRKKAHELIFGFGLFLVVLLPVLPFFWSRVFIVAERYSYISYIGIYLVLAVLFEKYFSSEKIKKIIPSGVIYSIVALWLIFLAGTSFNRTLKWRTTETLLQDVVATGNSKSDVAAAYFYLGNLYDQRNDVEKSINAYSEAINFNPQHFLAFNNRGILFGSSGRLNEAMKDFDTVLKLKPDYAEGWYNRGILLFQAGRTNEACSHWQRASHLGANHAALAYRQYCN